MVPSLVKIWDSLLRKAFSFSAHKYHNRYEFLADIERILENCILYNGKDSTYTQKAEKMVNVCRTTLDEVMDISNLFH